MKGQFILGGIGIVGSFIASLFGGWSDGLTILCIFMVIDFITGMTAAAMGESEKSPNGGISSQVIWKGILKKLMTLVLVVVGAQLDRLTGANYIRDTVVIAYCIAEVVSIIENAGLIGLPVPSIIQKVIDVLKEQNNNTDFKDES